MRSASTTRRWRASPPSTPSSSTSLTKCNVDKLDGKVSESFYERKAGEWRADQDRIAEAIQEHRRADRSYADAGVQLLELASGAHDAFMSQGSDGRRQLLQLVVSNSSWKHGQLAVEPHAPFDLILTEAAMAREADAADLAAGTERCRFENWPGSGDSNSRTRMAASRLGSDRSESSAKVPGRGPPLQYGCSTVAVRLRKVALASARKIRI